jgi:hypothetical protein
MKRDKVTVLQETKDFQETKELVQLRVPEGARCYWRSKQSGQFYVAFPKDESHPLFVRKCPVPKAFSDCKGDMSNVMGVARATVPSMVRLTGCSPAVFEVSVAPYLSLSMLAKMRLAFGFDGDKVRDTLREVGLIEVAKAVNAKIDSLFSEHKCKLVFVVYSMMPQCIPADGNGNIGMSVFTQLAMVGC